MTTSHSLAIVVDEPFTIHGRARPTAEAARLSSRLKVLLSGFVACGRAMPPSQSISGYYKHASDRACASAPVTSLRQATGGRR